MESRMESFIKGVLCLLIILLIWDNQGWFVYYLITCLSVDNMAHYGCFNVSWIFLTCGAVEYLWSR